MTRYIILPLLIGQWFAGTTRLFSQVILNSSVSLRSGSGFQIITTFVEDTAYLRIWKADGTVVSALDSSDILITKGSDTATIIRFEKTTSLTAHGLGINFILDNSSSMFHSYDTLTKYLDVLLDSIPGDPSFSAVAFDNSERQPTYDGTRREGLFIASSAHTMERPLIRRFYHFFDTIRTNLTPLYDAIWSSLEHITDRRIKGDSLRTDVALIVTDGDDNCSGHSITDLEALIHAMKLPLYVINYRSQPDGSFIWLITKSGGHGYLAETLPELRAALKQVVTTLTTGYKVVFSYPFGGPSVIH